MKLNFTYYDSYKKNKQKKKLIQNKNKIKTIHELLQ